ncbi:MAG TPA: hypothetical protein VMP01_11385 [Pirellulaceae bacterium]|nr:hypothetical protein [Pirellulaceae bacterium]
MNMRTFGLTVVLSAAAALAADVAFALGFELGETKEELKLVYDVKATDHGTGRVTITVTIADEGRLKPLDRGVSLNIPGKEGTGYADLSVNLERRKEVGKQVVSIHLAKELAERGSINLQTNHLDGKSDPRTWYYHRIPLADYLKKADEKAK